MTTLNPISIKTEAFIVISIIHQFYSASSIERVHQNKNITKSGCTRPVEKKHIAIR